MSVTTGRRRDGRGWLCDNGRDKGSEVRARRRTPSVGGFSVEISRPTSSAASGPGRTARERAGRGNGFSRFRGPLPPRPPGPRVPTAANRERQRNENYRIHDNGRKFKIQTRPPTQPADSSERIDKKTSPIGHRFLTGGPWKAARGDPRDGFF